MTTIDELEKLKAKLPTIADNNIQKRMEVYEQIAKGNSKLKNEEGIELKHYLESKQAREMAHRRKLIELMQDGNAYNKADIQARIDCKDEYEREILHEAEYKHLRAYASGISDLLSAILQNNSIIKMELR